MSGLGYSLTCKKYNFTRITTFVFPHKFSRMLLATTLEANKLLLLLLKYYLNCSVHVSSQLLHAQCSTVNSNTPWLSLTQFILANHTSMFFQYSDQSFMSPLLISTWLQPCSNFLYVSPSCAW
jgi:hypothetical protein